MHKIVLFPYKIGCGAALKGPYSCIIYYYAGMAKAITMPRQPGPCLPGISSLLPLTHHLLAEALLITQQDRLLVKTINRGAFVELQKKVNRGPC